MKKLSTLFLATILTCIAITTSVFANPDINNSSIKRSVTNVAETEVININHANKEMFLLLKGVGEKRAQAIVDFRELHGDFSTIEDLLNVKGIGEQVLNENKARLII